MTAVRYAANVRPMRIRSTASVRPFAAADIAEVAEVHRAAFRREATDPAAYRDYFTRVFLDPANAGRGISSLVHQEPDGHISGFVGQVPRTVTLDGRQYLAAVSSQFVVDPASRVGLVALRLVKACLDGPQDLSIADEANDVSRKIWEGLGGTTALLLSMYWTRTLRPARFGLSFLRERRALAPLAVAARPVAAFADTLAARLPGSPFRQAPRADGAEPLSAPALVERASDWCATSALRVDYDARTLQNLLDRAAGRAANGRVLHAAVKQGSTIAGWYVAHIDDAGVADVGHVAASPATISPVLDHLFHHAWRLGADSVTGRLDPRFLQALADKHCVFHRRGPWVLIKANAPELQQALDRGATCLSRFDGEWSLRFQPPAPVRSHVS